MHNRFSHSSLRLRLAGPLALMLLWAPGLATAPRAKTAPLPTDEAAIVHALNRMAFGPAAGDLARVRAMGLAQYVEQQLHPERLSDAAVHARLAPLATLTLPASEIARQYYTPLIEKRRELQRRESSSANSADAGAAGSSEPGVAPPPEDMPASSRPEPTGDAKRLANLSPDERRQAMALRREQQKVLGELGEQKVLRAVYSERQLEEVLVDFWFNHFNVFAGKGPVRVYLTEYERDAIRPHVLGNFRALLGAVAQSPAMLFYLDNWQSVDPQMALRVDRLADSQAKRRPGRTRVGPRRGAGRFENMADADRQDGPGGAGSDAMAQRRQRMPRGLNENYARELLELHTLGVDAGYTQKDIVEVAKAFTGWTIRAPRTGGGFWFDDRRHVKGAKHVFGATIDKGGQQDGDAVLDLLASHPATAGFIAEKLVRRFVSDNPSPALVARAAERFRATRGDLREVTRTVLTSPEFFAPEARRAKVKTPFEFVASALRASNAEIAQAGALLRRLRELGMPLYFAQPPTGYADRADAWINTGALVGRMNFALSLVENRLQGVRIDLATLAGSSALGAARIRLIETLLQDQVSDATKQTLANGAAVSQIAALALGSPEFQRR